MPAEIRELGICVVLYPADLHLMCITHQERSFPALIPEVQLNSLQCARTITSLSFAMAMAITQSFINAAAAGLWTLMLLDWHGRLYSIVLHDQRIINCPLAYILKRKLCTLFCVPK